MAEMNDRFRFRVWDEEDNTLYILQPGKKYDCDFVEIAFDGSLIGTSFNDEIEREEHSVSYLGGQNCVLEQCTGLKDENGKLIYEGDIVRVFYDHFDGNFTEIETIGPVKWECGTWVVNGWFLNHAPEYDETHLESAAVEVIGNIHENPELLEVEK